MKIGDLVTYSIGNDGAIGIIIGASDKNNDTGVRTFTVQWLNSWFNEQSAHWCAELEVLCK